MQWPEPAQRLNVPLDSVCKAAVSTEFPITDAMQVLLAWRLLGRRLLCMWHLGGPEQLPKLPGLPVLGPQPEPVRLCGQLPQ